MKPCITIKIYTNETWHIKAKKNASNLLISAVIANMDDNFRDEIEYFECCKPEKYNTLKGGEMWGRYHIHVAVPAEVQDAK